MLNNEVKVLLFEALSCDVPPYYLGGKIVLITSESDCNEKGTFVKNLKKNSIHI